MSDTFNMRAAMARLTPEKMITYLIAQDWEAAECRYENRLAFLGAEHEQGRYELILPESSEVHNYRVLLQRAVYKLCGIEDRQPQAVVEAIMAEHARQAEAPAQTSSEAIASGQPLRVRNRTRTPLKLRVASRGRDLELLPGEAMEVQVSRPAGGAAELEVGPGEIVIRDT